MTNSDTFPVGTQPLIVPIHLDALCVGSEDSHQRQSKIASQTARFSTLPYYESGVNGVLPYLSDSINREPFSTADHLQDGVHLHWALPKALTHGHVAYRITETVRRDLAYQGLPKAVLDILTPTPVSLEIPLEEAAFVEVVSKLLGETDYKTYGGLLLRTAAFIQYPKVPNRWLLLRVATNQGDGALQVKGWVIESDFFSTNAVLYSDSITVPYSSSFTDRSFRYMGRAIPLETWSEDNSVERFPDLTAIGYGEITFAAYYPNCKSVFGFVDRFGAPDDGNAPAMSNTKISYLVVGWYSGGQNDPLAAADVAAVLEANQWSLPESATPDGISGSLYYGVVENVQWDPDKQYILDDVTDESITVAVGNTIPEALAAYLTRDENPTIGASQMTVADYLEALQLGILNTLKEADNPLAILENRLHESGFEAQDGGSIWTVTHQGSTEERLDADDFGQVTLPEESANTLNDLNTVQQQYYRTLYRANSQRWQFYADWYKYVMLTKVGDSDIQGYLENVPDLLKYDSIDAIDVLNAELLDPSTDTSFVHLVQTMSAGYLTLLDSQIDSANYEIEQVPAPRFWRPKDPVILLVGDNVAPSVRYSQTETGQSLVCRCENHLISELTVSSETINASDLGAVQLSDANSEGLGTRLRDMANKLLLEVLLIDSNHAAGLAQLVSNRVSATDIQSAQITLPDPSAPTPGSPFQGYAPASIARNTWGSVKAGENPWHPISMQWRVQFHPLELIKSNVLTASGSYSNLTYAPTFITGNAHLDANHIDLVYQDRVRLENDYQEYEGWTVLSPNAVKTLNKQADEYFEPGDTVPDSVQTILDDTDETNTPVMAQAISGFHQALIMQAEQFQMDIRDPFKPPDAGVPTDEDFPIPFPGLTSAQQDIYDDLPFWAKVRTTTGSLNHTAPRPNNNFNPIRAGYMTIEKIRLIDVFGQYKDIMPLQASVARPHSLKPLGTANEDYQSYIALPPRIAQPARLLFTWKSARHDDVEMNSHPATTPIFGWVMINHLDDSLMIFDQDGAALGALRETESDGNEWEPAPGTTTQVDDISNDHLKNFVKETCDHQDLDAFTTSIEQALVLVEPQSFRQHDALAVLLGRPLALAQASLKLVIRGRLAHNQAYPPYNGETGDLGGTNPTRDFEKVQYPVRLGDLSLESDGLIGYYTSNASGIDYTNFHPEIEDNYVLLDADPGSVPLDVVLMLDPRAQVHAISGILPVQAIAIPPDQYQNALERLAFSFLVNPILGAKTETGETGTDQVKIKLRLPLPGESAHPWTWLEKSGADWQTPITQDEIGAVDDRATHQYTPQKILEGWLKLKPYDEQS